MQVGEELGVIKRKLCRKIRIRMSVRSSWVRDTQLAVAVVSTLPYSLSPLLVQERKQNSLNKRTIVLTKN